MPTLLKQLLSEEDIAASKSLPPAQQFFINYRDTVDSKGFTQGSGSKYYSKDVVFHNQNNAKYHGPDQM